MRRRHHLEVVLATCAPVILYASALLAYEVKPVTTGGTVAGTVKVKGEVAPTPELEVSKDQKTCGLHVPDESLVSSEGLLQNVVVSIGGITAGKEAADKPTLSNSGCRFVPHVVAMQVGQKLAIHNSDPILHNTHGTYEDGTTAFNIALPLKDQTIEKRIKKPGVIVMNCDAGHTWMSAYVLAFEHPYYAVTSEDGSFSITDVPPGTYTVTIWHEKLPATSVEVTVEAGKTASIEVELSEEG